jgi:hypothetical protein
MVKPGHIAPASRSERGGIETVNHAGQVICMLIYAGDPPAQTTFHTPGDLPLQVGQVVYPAGGRIPPHAHRNFNRDIRGTTEVLIVQRGRVTLNLYAEDKAFLCSRVLEKDDVIVLVSGGHGFEFAEDTVLLEVKQGPYLSDHDKDPL